MRIATITCYDFCNHGGALQAYALTHWLAAHGHDVEMIYYLPKYMELDIKLWYRPRSLRSLASLVLRYPYRRDTVERHRRHEEFAAAHLPLTKEAYSSSDHLAEAYDKADALIAGSDQIWNTDFPTGRDPAFYLDFGRPGVRRISYAASFAVQQVPAGLRGQLGSWISAFDAVSVRETSALEILQSMGCTGTRVCDPVFLPDPSFWSVLVAEGRSRLGLPEGRAKKPYMLVYDFYRDKAMRTVARRAARLRGLRIYSVGNMRLGYAARNFCDVGPAEFLALVAGASCVVSNSFHATAFAMLLGKDFLVVDRPDGLNARMHDITGLFGLRHRVVSPDCPDASLTAPVDYSAATPLIEAERRASRQWLLSALTGKNEKTDK